MVINDIKGGNYDLSNISRSLHIADPIATEEDYANLLSKIPEIFYLSITNSRVMRLPEQVWGNLKNLNSLSLDCSNLREVPEKWFGSELRQVSLKCPRLQVFPESVWKIPLLQGLVLNDLLLENIPDFEPVSELIYNFSLHAPNLKRLPNGIEKLRVRTMRLICPQIDGIRNLLAQNEMLQMLTMEVPVNGFNGTLKANMQLHRLIISNIESLSDGLLSELPPNLRDLNLTGKPTHWKEPLDLPGLPNLKNLTIANFLWNTLPDTLGECPELTSIRVNSGALTSIPETLLNCKKLEILLLNGCPLKEISPVMTSHPQLKTLRVGNSDIKEIPEDWSGASSLQELYFYKMPAKLDDLDFLETLPKIKKVQLHGNNLTTPYALMLKKGVSISYMRPEGLFYKDLDEFRKLCSAIAKSGISLLDKHWMVNFLATQRDLNAVNELDWHALLQATNINYGPFRKRVLSKIHELIDKQPKPLLSSDARLYISGKTKLTKTELKKKCVEIGVKVVNELDTKVTHVLLGTNCKEYEQLDEGAYVFLTENHFQEFYSLAKPGFLEEAEQQAEEEAPLVNNVSALLQSADAANVLIGLEMLKTGGVPKGIVEDLIVIQKTTDNSKVRSKVKKLLELHAPQEWLLVVRDNLSFKNITGKASENMLRQQLKKLAGRTSSEMAGRLSILLFKHFKRGLRYALLSKVPKEIKEEAMLLLFDDTHFDYSRGVGFKNWKNTKPEAVIMYSPMGSNAPLPVKAQELGKIESLNLHNCKYETIRREIVEFKDLTKLDLSHNWIKTIPGYFQQLQKLTELDLSFNIFEEFPIRLSKFKNLRRLDLRYNRSRQGFHPLTIPDAFREALPNCEVLV